MLDATLLHRHLLHHTLLRGSLLDIFPMGSETPFRIDLLDDEVDELEASFDDELEDSFEEESELEGLTVLDLLERESVA